MLNLFLLIFLFLSFYYGLKRITAIDTMYVNGLNHFASFLLFASKHFTELFGFEVTTYGKSIRIIDDLKAGSVFLDRGCMGRNVMLGFAGLIAVFPGMWKQKLWFIPLGLAILVFANVLRISGLAITAYCCPEYSDINHYFVFKIVAWAIIFLMWMWWFNKFALKAIKKKS